MGANWYVNLLVDNNSDLPNNYCNTQPLIFDEKRQRDDARSINYGYCRVRMNCPSVSYDGRRRRRRRKRKLYFFVCLNRSTKLLKINFEFVKSYRKYRSGNVEDIYGQQWLIQLSVIISLLRTGSITIWMGRAARRLTYAVCVYAQ